MNLSKVVLSVLTTIVAVLCIVLLMNMLRRKDKSGLGRTLSNADDVESTYYSTATGMTEEKSAKTPTK